MTTEKYPRGWNEPRVRRVLEYYETQTDEEAAAEIEAGSKSTTMEVPAALVPAVRALIAKRKKASTRATKMHNKVRILAGRGRKQTKSRRPTARRGKIRG